MIRNGRTHHTQKAYKAEETNMDKIEKSSEEWRAELAPDVYHITREAGTERPFSGQYNHFDAAGDYHCACCGALLFKSQQKFDSHCGWPAFFEQAEPQSTYRVRDLSHGMVREEVRCRRCDAHLGHVFPDGPRAQGGLRYCITGASLKFIPLEQMDAAGYGLLKPRVERSNGGE